MTTPVLSVRDLAIRFSVGGEDVQAVHAVDFDLHAGEVLAIVGESGSGKSVTSLAVLGLLPPNASVTGRILVTARTWSARRSGRSGPFGATGWR